MCSRRCKALKRPLRQQVRYSGSLCSSAPPAQLNSQIAGAGHVATLASTAGESVAQSDAWHREAEAGAWQAVQAALLDDLSTPAAVAALSEPLKTCNDLMFTKKGKKVRQRGSSGVSVAIA